MNKMELHQLSFYELRKMAKSIRGIGKYGDLNKAQLIDKIMKTKKSTPPVPAPRTKKSKIIPVPAPRTKKSKISTIIPIPAPRTKKIKKVEKKRKRWRKRWRKRSVFAK